jgi:hypothetical protein
MLVIPADTRVADIYFGKFMQIFDHLYARYIAGVMQEKGTSDPKAGFLKEKTEEWLSANFKAGGRKDLRRRYWKIEAGEEDSEAVTAEVANSSLVVVPAILLERDHGLHID